MVAAAAASDPVARGVPCPQFSTNRDSEVVGAAHSSDAIWQRYCSAQPESGHAADSVPTCPVLLLYLVAGCITGRGY